MEPILLNQPEIDASYLVCAAVVGVGVAALESMLPPDFAPHVQELYTYGTAFAFSAFLGLAAFQDHLRRFDNMRTAVYGMAAGIAVAAAGSGLYFGLEQLLLK